MGRAVFVLCVCAALLFAADNLLHCPVLALAYAISAAHARLHANAGNSGAHASTFRSRDAVAVATVEVARCDAEWHARVGARLEDVVPDPAQIVEVAPVRARQPTGFTGGRTGHLGLTKLRALAKRRDHPCEILLPEDREEEHVVAS